MLILVEREIVSKVYRKVTKKRKTRTDPIYNFFPVQLPTGQMGQGVGIYVILESLIYI
jgi:hypothetical protein